MILGLIFIQSPFSKATFLIPFLIEPVATIYAPYKMMMAIVRTQPSMKGFMAERLLGSLVFDLSRYADLMLDVMIAVLIFFFPGVVVLRLFCGCFAVVLWVPIRSWKLLGLASCIHMHPPFLETGSEDLVKNGWACDISNAFFLYIYIYIFLCMARLFRGPLLGGCQPH